MDQTNKIHLTPGTARLKAQFIIQDHVRELNLNFVAANDKKKVDNLSLDSSDEPPKKKLKGQNRHRPREKRLPKAEKLCFKIGIEGSCPFGDSCCYSHDIVSYLAQKPPDLGNSCYLYETFGRCPYSFSCRYASAHIKDNKNVINEDIVNKFKEMQFYRNSLQKETQRSLRSRKYDFGKSNNALKEWESIKTFPIEDKVKEIDNCKMQNLSKETVISPKNNEQDNKISSEIHTDSNIKVENSTVSDQTDCENTVSIVNAEDNLSKEVGPVIPDNTHSFSVVKKVEFKDKLYLAPLTTVGNLPFRRICKEFGADITCSEMAMSLSLLQGQQSEWALLKRHHTEDIFGIQLCGAHPDILTRCSQLLAETTSFDFLDLNLGCPLEMVYRKGAGCGLMNRLKKLEGIIYGITSIIDVPLTLKLRTGIYGGDNIAHNVVKKIHQWNDRISLITLHGRSREQRYTKSANWEYINFCNKLADPIPLFGNGDVLTFEDYNRCHQETNVAGAMIARGALIKPWIFTEIKEQRHWDISSSERFDILKKYSNYGLEHWGSDTEGIEKTRRFMLEWLSFLYRYIPVGLLECPPQKINERPPPYFGRNDLETLMASPSCNDWIKISEMLLGPVPQNFVFLPKHKANAYQ